MEVSTTINSSQEVFVVVVKAKNIGRFKNTEINYSINYLLDMKFLMIIQTCFTGLLYTF